MIALLSFIFSACALLLAPAFASAATGSISGTVTNVATSAPIEGIEVCAYTAAGDVFAECSFTGSNGTYTLGSGGLTATTKYKVEFSSDEGTYATQWYNGQATFAAANEVEATAVGTPNINAAMKETTGKISGTVIDAGTHGGVNNIAVCAEGSAVEFFSFGCARTNANGEYTIKHLHPGAYKVDFFSPSKYNETTEEEELESNYVTQYFNGKMHRSEAEAVTVVEGLTTTGINAAMQAGATITGTVTDATTNAALQGVEVCAWGSNVYYCSTTNGSGSYKIQTVSAGSFKVEFNPETFYVKFNKAEPEKEHWMRSELPLADYLRQYYNDKFSFEAAEAITITAGGTVSSINAKLTKEVQPPPPAGVAQVGPKAAVKGGKAMLQVKCTGTGPCSGVIKLSAHPARAPKAKKGKHNKKGSAAVTIGQAPFSIPLGKSKVVAVKLNSKGKASVTAAGKKGLKAKVSGTGVKSGTVTLTGPAPKKPHKK